MASLLLDSAEAQNDKSAACEYLAATVQIGLRAYENTETSPRATAPLAQAPNGRLALVVPQQTKIFAPDKNISAEYPT
jgi:hypothetical protein